MANPTAADILGRVTLVTGPEECTWGFLDLTGLLGRGVVSVMPTWTNAIQWEGRRHRETYLEYRQLIQLLLWRNPVPPGGVLVLKSPADTDRIDTFAEVFPEASFVLTHRDPFRCLTSVVRVGEIINGPFLKPDRSVVGTEGAVPTSTRMLSGGARAMVSATNDIPERVRSIDYTALMTDPAGTLSTVLESLSIPVDAQKVHAEVAAFLAGQRSGKRAKPPVEYSDYGIDHEGLLAEADFAAYRQAFGVSLEGKRLTDPAT
ncbi:MAG TPA: sulfotransferase [Nocardioidaceae bacterium]|nr:sulfotransferase [Nocardioidaceae bacterium]